MGINENDNNTVPVINLGGFSKGFRVDILLILVTIALLVIGVMFIYSSEYLPEEYKSTEIKVNTGEEEGLSLYMKQILFIVPSVILAFIVFLFNIEYLKKLAWIFYGGVVLLLILVLLFGETNYGSRSWFGIAGFGIQPSEFAKISVILALASYMNWAGEKMKDWRYFIVALMIPTPILGLILLQPDFGTILVFLPVIITMLFIGGCRVLHIVTVTVGGIIAILGGVITKAPYVVPSDFNFILALFLNNFNVLIVVGSSIAMLALTIVLLRIYKDNLVLRVILCIFLTLAIGLSGSFGASKVVKDHHIKRFISFFDPQADPQDTGYSLKQSIVAIGAGGADGQGWLEGKQNHLGFITVKWADYIFSVYAEEMGFKGTLLLLILYALFVFRGSATIYFAKDMFGGLVASGIVAMVLFQVFINLSVTIGTFPVVGITLPFISAGGSSIITFIVSVGLLLNIQYDGKSSRKGLLV